MSGDRRPVGVLGGMGPLASAEFVKTIYELAGNRPEQETPAIIMYSDPSFPDRTTAYLSGDPDRIAELRDRLTAALEFLCRARVSKTVIACITVHHWLPMMRDDLRAGVVSLLDVIADTVAARRRPHLMFCTKGTRQMRLFEQHARWDEMKAHIVMPTDEDQQTIHQLIYGVKGKGDVQRSIDAVGELLRTYGVQDFVAGCTEFHFAAK